MFVIFVFAIVVVAWIGTGRGLIPSAPSLYIGPDGVAPTAATNDGLCGC
jgi:hypothetical protein